MFDLDKLKKTEFKFSELNACGKIKGRLCTTHKDSLGDKFTLQDLENFDKFTDSNTFLNREQDTSQKPVGKILTHKIVKLDDGEYAIEAEIEIYDESVAKMKGFSIAFVR